MAVADGTVVGAPVVHDAIDILEAVLRGIEARHEPCGGPGGVSALVEHLVDFRINVGSPALGNLKDGPQTLHEIQASHRHRHAAAREEAAGEAAAAEVVAVGRRPDGVFEDGSLVLVREVPPVFHRRLSLSVLGIAVGIEGGGAGVDKMNHSLGSHASEPLARDAFHRFGAPICPDI